jgi:hypothetical protein
MSIKVGSTYKLLEDRLISLGPIDTDYMDAVVKAHKLKDRILIRKGTNAKVVNVEPWKGLDRTVITLQFQGDFIADFFEDYIYDQFTLVEE